MDIDLRVYDINGREVDIIFQGTRDQGQHQLIWDANHLASGVYFVYLNTGGVNLIRKAVLLK